MLLLYVDDGAFPFATREEMTQGATVIFATLLDWT
jgi:hypothetical protein